MKTIVIEGGNGNFTIISHEGTNLARMSPSARIDYWQRQGQKAIFRAAFQMIELQCRQSGIDCRIDRTVEFHSRDLADKR